MSWSEVGHVFLEWFVCGGSITSVGVSVRIVVSCDERYSGSAILTAIRGCRVLHVGNRAVVYT